MLKEYNEGKLLYYKTFTSNWYEALVYVDGEAATGYIHKGDIEYPVEDQKSLTGIALNKSTNVYSEPMKSSSTLKSYRQGKLLYFKTYLDQWYEALVYVDGEAQSGYIHVNDVEIPTNNPELLQGVAMTSPTNIYTMASKSSDVLKTMIKGQFFIIKHI